MNETVSNVEQVAGGVASGGDPLARLQRDVRTHMPALDGLRGLAIIAVVWHNSALTGHWEIHGVLGKALNLFANLGWLGVQLFFVLSGFLITGILLDQKGTQHQFRNFYMRRMLRIFPLYYAVLIIAFVLVPLWGVTPIWSVPNKSQEIWYWTYLVNWIIPVVGSGGGLSHFWSLAVEEQFYLLWPLAVISLSRERLALLCAALVISAIVVRAALIYYDPEFARWAAYEFTVARWDALAIGALLAAAVRYRAWLELVAKHCAWLIAATLLYILGYTALNHNFGPVEPGIGAVNQTVVALLFAGALFFGVARTERPAVASWQGLLRNAALRNIGKYSYAIYIFHFPIVVELAPFWDRHAGQWQHASPTLATLTRVLLVALMAYAMAWCSWRLLEQPCLRLKRFFASPAAH